MPSKETLSIRSPDDLLEIIIEKVEIISPKTAAMNRDQLGSTKMHSFSFDSLEVLQFAMDLEDVLGIEIEVDDLSEDLTLFQLAEHLALAATRQRRRSSVS